MKTYEEMENEIFERKEKDPNRCPTYAPVHVLIKTKY